MAKHSHEHKAPRFYSRYNPPPAVSIDFEPGSSLTKQAFKDECDINVLMRRYEVSGVQVTGNSKDPLYGDFTQATDFMEAQNTLLRAKEQFAGLSARVRERFHNNPAEFLMFVADPNNVDEAEKYGMLNDAAVERLRKEREAKAAAAAAPTAKAAAAAAPTVTK